MIVIRPDDRCTAPRGAFPIEQTKVATATSGPMIGLQIAAARG